MNEMGITGVNIPGQVAFNHKLTDSEKMLFWMISSLSASGNEVYGTNNYFAQKLNITEKTVSRSLKKLSKLGYIEVKGSSKRRSIKVKFEYFEKYIDLVTQFNEPYAKQSGTSVPLPARHECHRRRAEIAGSTPQAPPPRSERDRHH